MPVTPTLRDVLRNGPAVAAHRPWPRVEVSRESWEHAISLLRNGQCTLLGLWGETAFVHMALIDAELEHCGVLSLACEGNRFPSVGRLHPPAIRLERAIRDLVGLEPEGLADPRPGSTTASGALRHPLGEADHARRARAPTPSYRSTGEGLHQIPVGPVHAGIIEPGHFRFTANGETIVRLEERLGYVHKGIESLMARLPVERAAVLAGRVSGDSTVAYALAFCAGDRGRARIGGSAARGLAARADGRTGATGQSLRRSSAPSATMRRSP